MRSVGHRRPRRCATSDSPGAHRYCRAFDFSNLGCHGAGTRQASPACMRYLDAGTSIPGRWACVACAVACSFAIASRAEAAESVVRSLAIQAEVSTRTSLKVSTNMLDVDVVNPALPAVGAIEFSAGARTEASGEVLLILEPLVSIFVANEPGPASALNVANADADHETAIDVSTPGPKIARRWVGSGLRRGTLHVSLRAPRAGRYQVPLRMLLVAP